MGFGGHARMSAARFLTDGSLDHSYGIHGETEIPVGVGLTWSEDVVVTASGHATFVGKGFNGQTAELALARLLPDGRLDDRFDGGAFMAPSPAGPLLLDHWGKGIAVQPDGKILTVDSYSHRTLGGWRGFQLRRFLPVTGVYDVTFDGDSSMTNYPGNGVVTTFFAGGDGGHSWDVLVQPDGRILVAGTSAAGSGIAIARYFPSGALDPSFGLGGRVGQTGWLPDGSVTQLALAPDGKILIAGVVGTNENCDAFVARYLADGTPDTSFGAGGRVVLPRPGAEWVTSLLVQPNGRVVLAGHTSVLVDPVVSFVFRLLQNGRFDTSFGD
jgi:uncharacterized delta-60 repeat protein